MQEDTELKLTTDEYNKLGGVIYQSGVEKNECCIQTGTDEYVLVIERLVSQPKAVRQVLEALIQKL